MEMYWRIGLSVSLEVFRVGTAKVACPLLNLLASGGHGDLTVLDTSGRNESLSGLPNFFGAPSDDKDFEAIMSVQMHMDGRDDKVIFFMLDFGQLLGKLTALVVVHHCHRAHHFVLGFAPLILDQPVPYQISNCLRSVSISFLRYEAIEFLQQVFRYRDSESYKIGHFRILPLGRA
jgi:hypothetical protein